MEWGCREGDRGGGGGGGKGGKGEREEEKGGGGKPVVQFNPFCQVSRYAHRMFYVGKYTDSHDHAIPETTIMLQQQNKKQQLG